MKLAVAGYIIKISEYLAKSICGEPLRSSQLVTTLFFDKKDSVR